jgi:hypothetical protein
MSKVEELKADIERLPGEEVSELFRWLSEKEWESWDKEIEADSEAGKLDFLVREAHEGKARFSGKELAGLLRSLPKPDEEYLALVEKL